MTTLLDRPMRPAPATPLDATGAPQIGAYAGSLDHIDLDPLKGTGLAKVLRRRTREKRWQYVMLTSDEVVAALAIVDLGYAANGFLFAASRATGALIFDQGFLGTPFAVQVGLRPGVGAHAHFRSGRAELKVERVAGAYLGTARVGDALSLDFTLDTAAAPPAVTLVVPVPGGTLNCTQKWAGLPLRGSLVVGTQRFDLNGGSGGLDYTCGLMARETLWRWGFGAGRTTAGEPVGFNLGEGINDAVPGENALWFGDAPSYLPSVRFTFDRDQPASPWHLRSDDGGVDLTFTTIGVHREQRDLGVAKSRFVQVAGAFSGVLRGPGGRRIAVRDLPGVVEDQFARW